MKHYRNSKQWLQSALVGVGLAASINIAMAVPDRVLGTFDTGITGTPNWAKGWGGAAPTFDATQDNTGNNGGACYISGDFTLAVDGQALNVYGCISGNPWWHPDPPFDMTLYKSLEFDIKWDPTSTLSLADFNSPPSGGEGGIAIWNSFDGNNWPTVGRANIPAAAATGWAHVSIPINPATADISVSYGIMFKKWIAATQIAAGGTFAFWVDNVVLKGTDAPPPPPTLALAKTVPGLDFVAASGGQYDRQEIRTVGSNYSWVGASGPVSYSVNVAQIANNAHPGFQLFTHLVPGTPNPTRADSDYHEPNVVMWRIMNNADGSAWSDLRFKTNAPESNGNMWTEGQGGFPGGVWNPTTVGTWTITFNQNTNVIITAPGGNTVTNNFTPGVIAIFNADPHMQVNVGCVPGELSRLGQMAIVKGVKITGTPGQPNVDSNFVGQSPDTNVWTVLEQNPNGVQEIPLTAPFWLTWTLPANGFSLQDSDKVAGGIWASPALSSYAAGGMQYTLLNATNLPGANGFFRMIKRVGTKLLVLLPGETAAPGTPTGKTGTPTFQVPGLEFDVTVNLCDANYYLVTSPNDEIAITSSDNVATLPANPTLINGTATFKVTLWQEGTQTVTASDVTNPAITAGSGSVAVHP